MATRAANKTEWRQEVLFVKRNERGAIVQVQEKEPDGFESDVKWVQIEKPERVRADRRYWD